MCKIEQRKPGVCGEGINIINSMFGRHALIRGYT